MALMTYVTLYTDLTKLNIKIIDENLVEHLSKKDMNDDYIKYLSSMKDLDNDLLKYLLSNNISDGDMINYIDKYLTNLIDIDQKVKEIDPKLATFIETSSDSFIVSELVNKLKSESDKDSNNDSIKDKKKDKKKPLKKRKKKASVKKNSDDSK